MFSFEKKEVNVYILRIRRSYFICDIRDKNKFKYRIRAKMLYSDFIIRKSLYEQNKQGKLNTKITFTRIIIIKKLK